MSFLISLWTFTSRKCLGMLEYMLIGAHIIVGAGLGSLTNHPLAAFGVGVASHFLGDKIPHWEYSVKPLDMLKGKRGIDKLKTCFSPLVVRTLCLIGIEIIGGFLLVWLPLILSPHSTKQLWTAFAGGLGGLLPDVLWGLADNSTSNILRVYQRVHHASHTKAENVSLRYGLSWQLVVVALSFLVLRS